jgi:predicted amidohydrolase
MALAACSLLSVRHSVGVLRVGAIGWTTRQVGGQGFEAFERLVGDATSRGARLVVSPEAAFVARPGEREALLSTLGGIARAHRVYLAVGYLDHEHDENRLVFVDPDGVTRGEYTKTHLVPTAETSRPGSGEPVIVDVDGVKVGAMICQDDNFTDVARAYQRAGVQLVVTPTFEMSPAFGALHLRNALLRPIEGRFAYVRAVANGTSAIVSHDGTVLASFNHLSGGAAAIVADVPYGPSERARYTRAAHSPQQEQFPYVRKPISLQSGTWTH